MQILQEFIVAPTKARLKNALYGSALFVPARNAYQGIFNRAAASLRSRMQSFYGQFFQQGDLVFDIGANAGDHSEIFADLGAKVIAVEPNPECCKVLHKLSRRSPVTVEQCAVGDSVGTIRLHLSAESTLSTVSERWVEKTKEIPSLSRTKWLNSIEVPVTTLDVLAERHGIPRYVKIDVEGYEEQVLSGLSFFSDFLSFEFHILSSDVATRCMERLRGYDFNVIVGSNPEFVHSTWVPSGEISDWMASYRGDKDFGDIFARRKK